MNLFKYGKFTAASGQTLNYKIECDALQESDWKSLAAMIIDKLGHSRFKKVLGVPSGGMQLSYYLSLYEQMNDPNSDRILVVDDVWTTGKSMREFARRNSLDNWYGVVVFSRGPRYNNVFALFEAR
jgi:orotate phosphoribosyltransferase